jgi:hypothetical protein
MRKRQSKRIVLSCCGYKRCPTAWLRPDGSLVLEDKDDGKDDRILLAPEQVDKLRALLES